MHIASNMVKIPFNRDSGKNALLSSDSAYSLDFENNLARYRNFCLSWINLIVGRFAEYFSSARQNYVVQISNYV